MRNDKYWEHRAAELMYGLMDGAEAEANRIAKIYQRASGWLSLEAQDIFERFQAKHGLTEAEARRLISRIQNKEDLKELLRKLESGDYSEIGKRELIRMLEAPAFQARLERLQQLQNQISRILRDVYKQELDQSTRFYTDLANEAYYRSMFEIQQRAGYGFSFNHVDDKTVNRILKSKWSGKNYSKRIWKNTQALAEDVKEEVLVNFITGRTDREAAEVIRNKFGSGAMQARRLIRTESCFVSGEMVAQSYKEAGIEKYRYVATLDLRTSKICRELDGQEFLVKDRKAGVNYPPMHPWCRSTTISAPTAEELADMKRRAWDPESNRNILVPASMTYKEWYQKFVKGKPKAEQKEKYIIHGSADRSQYDRYRKILGDEVPETLEKFQEMKYNNPESYDRLKRLYRVVNQYEVNHGEMSAEKIMELHDEAVRQKALFNSKGHSKGASMGILELDGELFYANSKVHTTNDSTYTGFKGDRSKLIVNPEHSRFKAKHIGTHLRDTDSEYKLFEYAAKIADDGKPHIVYLLSEKCMCDSCYSVMIDFVNRYPNVTVNAVSHRQDRAIPNKLHNRVFEFDIERQLKNASEK